MSDERAGVPEWIRAVCLAVMTIAYVVFLIRIDMRESRTSRAFEVRGEPVVTEK